MTGGQTTAYRPPAPRPAVPPTADPNQSIISPGNVAVTAAIPLHLGRVCRLCRNHG